MSTRNAGISEATEISAMLQAHTHTHARTHTHTHTHTHTAVHVQATPGHVTRRQIGNRRDVAYVVYLMLMGRTSERVQLSVSTE